jgi:prepilin-type processing-associated H-X9-DG protein
LVEEKQFIYGNRIHGLFDQRSGKMLSWAVLLLPYLEEQTLYNEFDFSRSILDQPLEPQERFVPSLVCPSDGGGGRFFTDAEATLGKRIAKGNYAAYASPFHLDLQLIWPGALISTGQKLSRVIDGTNKTLVFSEVRTRAEERDERGAWALPWNGASLLAADMHFDVAKPGDRYFITPAYAYQVQLPNTVGPNLDVLVICPEESLAGAQLDGMPCAPWEWDLGLTGYISSAPRSQHPGGVNSAFLDGHVDFITNDIDPFTFAYMVSVDDEEPVDPHSTGGPAPIGTAQ